VAATHDAKAAISLPAVERFRREKGRMTGGNVGAVPVVAQLHRYGEQ
jgi:hypothetical protein